VAAVYREEINELAAELSDDAPGSPGYLRNYSRARSNFEQGLSEEERQRCKAMAKEWSESKLPPRMQQRYAHDNDSSRLLLTNLHLLA
jgi:hypothetical protein